MSSVDKNRDMAVCGEAYNRVTPTDPVSLGTTACLNRDEARAQCARHLIVVNGTLTKNGTSTQAKDLGISYNETTGKYSADKCESSVSGGRRKRRTKKSKKGGKSKKSGGRRRRRTQRRNR